MLYARFTQVEDGNTIGEHTGHTNEVAIDFEVASDGDDKIEVIVRYNDENDELQVVVGDEIVYSVLGSGE